MEIYLDLREKIEDRIEEIDKYYELNFDKPNSQYFEKGRMKLKKLLIYEPSNIKEMNIEINNKKLNKALVINGTNKDTIESNNSYNNTNNNSINNINSNDEISLNILNKSLNQNLYSNNIRKGKVKFIPLKEKKWKKNKSLEKSKINKDEENIYSNNNNNYNYKKINDRQNNHIYINKQSNVYINKNYNLFQIYRGNNLLNQFMKKKQKNSYVNNNYKIQKGNKSINTQENSFNNNEYI